jgi:hypothetical protein
MKNKMFRCSHAKEGNMEISEKVKKLAEVHPVRDKAKLAKQLEYYKKLSDKGLIKKQTYNIKGLAAL